MSETEILCSALKTYPKVSYQVKKSGANPCIQISYCKLYSTLFSKKKKGHEEQIFLPAPEGTKRLERSLPCRDTQPKSYGLRKVSGVSSSPFIPLQTMTTTTTGMVTSNAHAHLPCTPFQPLDPSTNLWCSFLSLLSSFSCLLFLQSHQSRGM